jgi:hypothetical protein
MTLKVLPITNKDIKTLEEDEDQGEMDMIFFLTTTLYTSYLFSLEWLYDEKDRVAVSNFHIIMSNIWAFYPIMQAQGLWLKLLICLSGYFSITWHWRTDLHLPLPGNGDFYGKGDIVFSIVTIISYCLSWIPRFNTKLPTKEEERNCWYYNCRGRPKETSEWRCRWTTNLLINILACVTFGSILYISWDSDEVESIQIMLCWVFIMIAVLSAVYQLLRGEMTVGNKNRKLFAWWVVMGTVYGIIAFVHKQQHTTVGHCIWHVYVMSCAYSFSRASEYLEIY